MRDSSLSWQKKLAQGFSSAADLLKYLDLPLEQGSILAEKQFATRVPLGFARRMQKANPSDPLLLQVLAVENELVPAEEYELDPLKEMTTNPVPGLIHKYHGRVLLTLTGVCAVNCRFCFRRHFPYQNNNPGRQGWAEVCDYLEQDDSISEVILSGGDPLLAADSVLSDLIYRLEDISHVKTIRFHTRIPVVFPERIDKKFLFLLEKTSLNKVMVLHCNHAQELDEEVFKVCIQLRKAGCHLLNQSVLLTGINDNADILASLSQKLCSYGIMPYYLHVLDKVQGAAHFDMPLQQAKSIYHKLQSLVPGYLLPRLAREVPGKTSKTLLI